MHGFLRTAILLRRTSPGITNEIHELNLRRHGLCGGLPRGVCCFCNSCSSGTFRSLARLEV